MKPPPRRVVWVAPTTVRSTQIELRSTLQMLSDMIRNSLRYNNYRCNTCIILSSRYYIIGYTKAHSVTRFTNANSDYQSLHITNFTLANELKLPFSL